MQEAIGPHASNEKEIDPLGQTVIDFMMAQMRESSFLDFKKIISIAKDSDFPKIVKDILGFANNGGGYIIIGFQENDGSNKTIKRRFVPVGLPPDFGIDQAALQEKVNSFLNIPLQIGYIEFEHIVKLNRQENFEGRFGMIYVPPGPEVILPKKSGEYKVEGKTRSLFAANDIIIRRGTQNVIASEYELNWIRTRSRDTSYKLSILSGKPDEVNEILYSNIFEVTKVPKYVWIGTSLYDDSTMMRKILKEKSPYANHSIFRSRPWNGKIVALHDLTDEENPYHYLVKEDVIKEEISKWFEDVDKRRIIIELLNNEIRSFAIARGLFFDYKSKKLYFPSASESRTEEWPSRYKVSKKTVVGKVYSVKLGKFIFWHAAIDISIQTIGNKLYLNVYPTFGISDDGRKLLDGMLQGTVITSLQFKKFNDQYLNNILFWIKKLSDGNDELKILPQFIVSGEPINTSIDYGIRWDIPTSEIKNFIENYKPVSDEGFEEDLEFGDDEDEF